MHIFLGPVLPFFCWIFCCHNLHLCKCNSPHMKRWASGSSSGHWWLWNNPTPSTCPPGVCRPWPGPPACLWCAGCDYCSWYGRTGHTPTFQGEFSPPGLRLRSRPRSATEAGVRWSRHPDHSGRRHPPLCVHPQTLKTEIIFTNG